MKLKILSDICIYCLYWLYWPSPVLIIYSFAFWQYFASSVALFHDRWLQMDVGELNKKINWSLGERGAHSTGCWMLLILCIVDIEYTYFQWEQYFIVYQTYIFNEYKKKRYYQTIVSIVCWKERRIRRLGMCESSVSYKENSR